MTTLQIIAKLEEIKKECREERTYNKLTYLIEALETELPGKLAKEK